VICYAVISTPLIVIITLLIVSDQYTAVRSNQHTADTRDQYTAVTQ